MTNDDNKWRRLLVLFCVAFAAQTLADWIIYDWKMTFVTGLVISIFASIVADLAIDATQAAHRRWK